MYLFIFLISIMGLLETGEINCSYNPIRSVFTLTDGPIDLITKQIALQDAHNIKHLDKYLYTNSLILEKRIEYEVENKILPTLLEESLFSSWVRNVIIHHQVIPRITPSTNLLNSSIKMYTSTTFSDNICQKMVNHIDRNIVKLIKTQLVPHYFLFSSSYNKIYESYIHSDENSVPPVTFNFFKIYNFDVSVEKMNIIDELYAVKWRVSNKDLSYVVLDIPHIDIIQFQQWVSSTKFEDKTNQQYILLFRLPVDAQQLSWNDQKIKIKQVKSIVEKIEKSNNFVHQLSITGGFSCYMIQEIQKENIHTNIRTIYTDSNTLQVLYNSLKADAFNFDEKNENLYRKLLNISEFADETTIRSFYDHIYKTPVHKSFYPVEEEGLDLYLQKPFKEYLKKIQYNFHCKNNEAFFNCLSLIHEDNLESVRNKPIFWIGLHPAKNKPELISDVTEALKQIHTCQGYDLYNIIHTYLLHSYVPLSFYIKNCYYHTAQNIIKDYLFCTNKDSMHVLYQVFLSHQNKWSLKVINLLDLLFSQSKMKTEKKINFIMYLCEQYPGLPILITISDNLILKNEERDELKKSFKKNAKKIINAVKLKLNFICDKNFFLRTSSTEFSVGIFTKEIELFFDYFPQLKKPGVLCPDIEREELIEKFICKYSNKNIKYKGKKISNKEGKADLVKESIQLMDLFNFLLEGFCDLDARKSCFLKIIDNIYPQHMIENISVIVKTISDHFYTITDKKINEIFNKIIKFVGSGENIDHEDLQKFYDNLKNNIQEANSKWEKKKSEILINQNQYKFKLNSQRYKSLDELDLKLSKKRNSYLEELQQTAPREKLIKEIEKIKTSQKIIDAIEKLDHMLQQKKYNALKTLYYIEKRESKIKQIEQDVILQFIEFDNLNKQQNHNTKNNYLSCLLGSLLLLGGSSILLKHIHFSYFRHNC